jgi:hypothetical protein
MFSKILYQLPKSKLHGLSPQANYIDFQKIISTLNQHAKKDSLI